MALTILSHTGSFDPDTRDKASLATKVARAVFGAGTAAQRQTARVELLQRPDFTAYAKTTDNSAASKVLDLSALGVTFNANKSRRIRFLSRAVNGTDSVYQEWEAHVWGNDGTTPKIMGSAKLIKARGVANGTVGDYGFCYARATYSTDTATADTAASSAGCSLGNNSTNTITLTHPTARTSPKFLTGVNNCPASATASGARHVQGISASATTISLFVTDLATPSAASPAPSELAVGFYILPHPTLQIAMNSNAVEIQCGYDSSDNVYHTVEVYVGKEEDDALAVD